MEVVTTQIEKKSPHVKISKVPDGLQSDKSMGRLNPFVVTHPGEPLLASLE